MHVYDYIERFICQGKPKVPTNIRHFAISVQDESEALYGMCNSRAKIGILPLLRMHKSNPGFALRFSDTCGNHPNMYSMLSRENLTWWSYVDKAVTRVMYKEDDVDYRLLILITPDAEEDWMDPENMVEWYHRGDRLKVKKEWEQGCGLASNEVLVDVAVDPQLL